MNREINMTFIQFCQENNIQLLKDDLKHLRGCLKYIPESHRKSVVRRYAEIWADVAAKCESSSMAQNKGRRAANVYLLELKK